MIKAIKDIKEKFDVGRLITKDYGLFITDTAEEFINEIENGENLDFWKKKIEGAGFETA